jgi:hypothetical protein
MQPIVKKKPKVVRVVFGLVSTHAAVLLHDAGGLE